MDSIDPVKFTDWMSSAGPYAAIAVLLVMLAICIRSIKILFDRNEAKDEAMNNMVSDHKQALDAVQKERIADMKTLGDVVREELRSNTTALVKLVTTVDSRSRPNGKGD